MSAMALMSAIDQSGLEGVSSQTILVLGRRAAFTAAASCKLTMLDSMPSGRMTLSKRRKVPPYTSSPERT